MEFQNETLRENVDKKTNALNETCCILYKTKEEIRQLKDQVQAQKQCAPDSEVSLISNFPANKLL